MFHFKPTEIKNFILEKDFIQVEVQNDDEHFAWRLVVNGSASNATSHYPGLLVHNGYALATDYWAGYLPAFVPVKLTPAKQGVKAEATP